jgi:phosphoribosylglycinamide formyltransferase-1
VASGDSPDSLAERVLAAEHRLYPQALAWIASGRACVDGDKVRFANAMPAGRTLFAPRLDDG